MNTKNALSILKNTAPTSKTGQTRKSYKDLLLALAFEGEDAGSAVLSQIVDPRHSLEKALQIVKNQAHKAWIKACLESLPPVGDGQRGRSSPVVGETRTYVVQEVAVKDDDGNTHTQRFVRVPVSLSKGTKVPVSFEETSITIKL
jgi:hypothetical protein